MIRVLVVDDSAVLRQSTKLILESDPEIQVVGVATNGAEATALAARLQPDVITMDIRMPKMDGLEAIRAIMAEHPAPIVVVTGIDPDRDMHLFKEATRLGAVAVLKRPESIASPSHKVFVANLIQQVKTMSGIKVIRRTRSHQAADAGTSHAAPPLSPPVESGRRSVPDLPPRKTEIVAIGASTGGPAALYKILAEMPANFPVPIVIVQHISFGFVEGLASWLNDASPLRVKVAQQGERLAAGHVYVAPDEHHMLMNRFNSITLSTSDPVSGHRPSVTALFQSTAQSYGPAAMAAILTGMGSDGAIGMKALRDAVAITIAQNQASCVVFGMPKEAIALGGARHVVPLDKIAQSLQELMVI